MKDEKYTPEVGGWLKAREVSPADSQAAARRVAARLPHVRQRSRWWPIPVHHRRTRTPTSTSLETTPTPSIIGRTHAMFSPVKAIAAGALILAIGGAALVAQPFAQQASVPGAEGGVAPEPVAFTANYSYESAGPQQVLTLPNGTVRSADAAWVFPSTEASDPRFEGIATMNATTDRYDGVSLSSQLLRIENESGAWQDGPYFRLTWADRDTPGDEETVLGDVLQRLLVGEGEYEGLVALVVDTASGPGSFTIEGVIFDGDLPPAPEPFSPDSQE